MLTDEQFGQQLGARLRHATDDVHADPDLARTLRRRQVRRTRAVRGATITAVVAAAAVVVAVVSTGAGHQAPAGQPQAAPPTPGTGTQAPVVNVAYVQQRTIEAVSKAADYVILAKNTYDSGHYEVWIDKSTQRYRNDVYDQSTIIPGATKGMMTIPPGPPPRAPVHLHQSHAVSGPPGDQSSTTVDYDTRTWFTGHITDRPEPASGVDTTDADSVRKATANGTVELLGNEAVDGRDTLHLRMFGPNRAYRIDMWVEATSYLPVREVAAKGGPDEFPESATETTTYTWLPRTAENLAKLTLTPPPDFRHTN